MDILSPTENIKCSKHSNKLIILVQVNKLNDNKHIFYCDQCIVYDQDFKSSNYVTIQQIIEFQKNCHIANWPPIDDDSIKKQIQAITDYYKKENNSKIEKSIKQYFNNMKVEVNKQIDQCEKNAIKNSLQFTQQEMQILKKIKEIQKVEAFKNILQGDNSKSNKKEQECREFINQVLSQKFNYTQQIKQLFEELEQKEKYIDFDLPIFIKNSILQSIESISFFKEQYSSYQNSNIQQDRNQNHNESKVNKLLELISAKSNFLTDQFMNDIQKVLSQMSVLINQISFDQIYQNNKGPIDFSNLCNKKMNIIRDLTEYYTQQSTNTNLTQQIKQSNQFKQVSSILSNKTNFLKENFVQEFESFIIETFPLFNKINFNNTMKENQQIQTFISIEEVYLQKICKLINKKRQLEQNNLYNNSQSIEVQKQISTLLQQFRKKGLENLLREYPIYDLIEPIQITDLLPQMNFIKQDFKQKHFQNLQINKLDNKSLELISLTYNNQGSLYSNFILERNKKYEFLFQFEKSHSTNYGFSIGLVRDDTKDTNYSYIDKLSFFLMFDQLHDGHNPGHGIDKKVYGNLIKSKGINRIELRVCLNEGILEVLDYPNYNHKYSIEDQYRNDLQTQQYFRLAIHLLNEIDVTLVKANICNEFND